MSKAELLLTARPSWWNYFWHFVFFFLLLPPAVALFRRYSLLFSVYENRIVLEKGLLNKEVKEIFISDIRIIDVRQRLLQRMFGYGDIMIAVAGTETYEDVAKGLPYPMSIKDRILAQRE